MVAAAALAAIAGCSQNPQFRMALASEAYGSLNTLYALLARAELGGLRHRSSFAGQVESYAAVIGGFEAARLLVAGHPIAAAAEEGARPADLNDALDRCLRQVRRMAETHRVTGIAPGASVTRAARVSCDSAARTVAAESASAWLVNVAAGDL